MKRQVTEQDLRAPEFKEGSPSEYEFRDDGKVVRKDRWEVGFRKIAAMLNGARSPFEIQEVVEQARVLVEMKEKEESHDDIA